MKYDFIVKIQNGLHARPCVRLVEILKEHQPLQIIGNGKMTSGLSILELLLLKVSQGESVCIESEYPLPDMAIQRLQSFFGGSE